MSGPRWGMPIGTFFKLTSVGGFLMIALPGVLVYLFPGPPNWTELLLLVGGDAAYWIVFYLVVRKAFGLVWNDASRRVHVELRTMVVAMDEALEATGMHVVRRKYSSKQAWHKDGFDMEYQLPSEGLRVGVDSTDNGLLVYVGPREEGNGAALGRLKSIVNSAIDRAKGGA